jgi:hypothetical protein
MNTSKAIDSCIEEIKNLLGDENNELTSGQRKDLTACVRRLKRLRSKKLLKYQEVYIVVAQVAKVVHTLVKFGVHA